MWELFGLTFRVVVGWMFARFARRCYQLVDTLAKDIKRIAVSLESQHRRML